MYAFWTAGGARGVSGFCPTRRTPRPWPCGFSTSGRIPNRNRRSSLRRAGQKPRAGAGFWKRPWSLKPAGSGCGRLNGASSPCPRTSRSHGKASLPAEPSSAAIRGCPSCGPCPAAWTNSSRWPRSLAVSIGTCLSRAGTKSVMSLTPDTLGQPGRTLCVVGPEGGFTAQEVEKLTRAGFLPATLGERVLRWETAAVLCLGLHWWKRQLGGK